MKAIKHHLVLFVILAFAQQVAGQAPNISFNKPVATLVVGSSVSISPFNSGGAVPATIYGSVKIFVGGATVMPGYLNGPDTSARLNIPQQMVQDASGNFYVVCSGNNGVRKITPAGLVSTFAGDLTGLPGLQNGTGTSALFYFPDGLAIDGSGNLYVAEYNNNAIRKITPDSVVTTFYTLPAPFGPAGLCFDNAGNLIVTAQDANQILSINPSGVASVIAGSTTAGYVNGPVASAQFNNPTDVRVDGSGNMFIVDDYNNAIRKITPGGIVSTVAGSAVSGNTPGYADGVGTAAIFNLPAGLVMGAGGVIYVADMYNHDIRRIMPDGTVSLLAGSAVQATGDSDGAGAAAGFSYPVAMYIDNNGIGYISEFVGARIRKVVLTGYSITGTLPPGLTFDPTTGTISGTPAGASPAANYTVTGFNTSGFSQAVISLGVALPANASLIALTPNTGALSPAFTTANTNYALSEPNAVTTIKLTPTTSDNTAVVTINGSIVASGALSPAIPLSVGSNSIQISVVDNGGATESDYTVIVTRAPSANDNLSAITLSAGMLSPAFSAGTTGYTASVSNVTSSITVTPTTTDANATIKVNGTTISSGTPSGPIALAVGANTITTVVTAQDGTTIKTYTITITRAKSVNASLASMNPSITPLSPAFTPATTSYTLSVANTVTSMTVKPITSDANATIKVNGTAVVSGTVSAPIALAEGAATAISVVVTAQDGTTTKTYTITVTRAASVAATLSNITLSTGTLSPVFAAATIAYTTSVSNSTSTVTLTPTATDANATIKVNGALTSSGTPSGPIALAVGTNTITTVVTAQNGTITQTYTVTVTRVPSINASLASMSPSVTPLSPTFAPAILSYTVAVKKSVSTITVKPVTSDSNATMTINGSTLASGTTSAPIALAIGSNTISVIVTAQDGKTTKTYTITVTRSATGANSYYPGISVTIPIAIGTTEVPTLEDDVILVHQGVSPNGDGLNDFLVIDGIQAYPDNKLTIMNRSGQLIYEAKGYDNSSKTFDGHSNKNGQMQLPGTYFYSLDYTVKGVSKHKTGFIVLKY